MTERTYPTEEAKIEARDNIVSTLKKNYKFVTLEATDELYVLWDGVYVTSGKPEAIIKEKCEDVLGKQCTRYDVAEVTARIKRLSIKPSDYFDKTPLWFINVKNGVLNIESMEMTKSSFPFLNKINAAYDPQATCPAIDKFLREITAKGKEEDVQAIYEWIGYCLWRGYPIHKLLLLLGIGRNGKTTLQNLMTIFLEPENVSHITLPALAYNRFSAAGLFGKLANLRAEIIHKPLKHFDLFKELTGDDYIEAEKKFVQNPQRFRNTAKLCFACNQLPDVRGDDTVAFWSRWRVIDFPNIFDPQHADPNILDKLTTDSELSGLLNKAIEGLKRLLTNKEFSGAISSEETRERFLNSITVTAFVGECIEEKLTESEETERVYEHYINFCQDNNYTPLNKIEFGKQFAPLTGARNSTQRKEGDTVHVYKGVRLKALKFRWDKDEDNTKM